MDSVLFSSKSDEWCTPKDLFDYYNDQFAFTLDPASSVDNHLCDKFYTLAEDGLSKDWSGEVVFCNPPYSNIKSWVKKAYFSECISVFLVPARTDTSWFHDYCLYNPFCTIRFLRGRLRFSGSKNSAPFPSMILIFRNNV